MAEQPAYDTVKDLGDGVTVRKYPKQVLLTATSRIEADAYTKLLAYVSGRNAKEKSVPTIPPVFSRESPSGNTIAFTVQKGYTVKDLPDPVSRDIEIKDVEERFLAVVSFTGYLTSDSFERNLAILKKKLGEKNIKAKGRPCLLRYDQPHAPPLKRRNEIGLEVE